MSQQPEGLLPPAVSFENNRWWVIVVTPSHQVQRYECSSEKQAQALAQVFLASPKPPPQRVVARVEKAKAFASLFQRRQQLA